MVKKCFLMFLALVLSYLFGNEAVAQKCLNFRYDADGNRVRKVLNYNCLIQRDMDDVQEQNAKVELTIYPNPTDGNFRIVIPKEIRHEKSCYKLYDINGMLLFDDVLHSDVTEVDVGNCPSGVYLLRITNGEDELSKIILKQ